MNLGNFRSEIGANLTDSHPICLLAFCRSRNLAKLTLLGIFPRNLLL